MTQERQNMLEERLQQIDMQIQTLREQAAETTGDAREQFDNQIETLKSQRDELQQRLSALESANGDALDDMSAGFEKAWNDLKNAVDDVMKRFQGS